MNSSVDLAAFASADPEVRRDAFLEFALSYGVLRFGDFELKSGRRSPYFFNAGGFDDANAMAMLGAAYAAAIVASGIEFDVLFGPAYKGIPLAVATGVALARDHGVNCGIAFNRKERKDHGEGGQMVGAPLVGRILLVDDVITAGTAVREVLPLIGDAGGTLVGILTALDRQERGQDRRSATEELAQTLQVPVESIVTLADLIAWLGASGRQDELDQVAVYRQRYGSDAQGDAQGVGP
ncbi:MAG TPA: orotate phosphoribosyltransferase [Pseudomonadales bacterium]|nr:orotate phosphoribosyltransferase [Pseudomonadales bacterium]